jgi:hypothetical protein
LFTLYEPSLPFIGMQCRKECFASSYWCLLSRFKPRCYKFATSYPRRPSLRPSSGQASSNYTTTI